MKKILIVDDEPGIVLGLSDQLEMEGHTVITATDGEAGLAAEKAHGPDLIILDVMLPKKGGFEVCKQLRREGCRAPILMLTAKGEEIDKVLGLELGADDYVTKPFSLREVTARVKAILRRVDEGSPPKETALLVFGPVVLDFRKMEAHRSGRRIEFTAREFRIMRVFAERPGEVITRDEFLDKVWGQEIYITNRSVDNQIANIRKKLEADPDRPRYILSIRSAGYKFVPEGESS
jgi:DNA-binding response OmpR family regulator